MKIIKPSILLVDEQSPEYIIKKIEDSARVCYQSEPKTHNKRASENFIRNIINRGHESVLEHYSFTYDVITNRAIHLEHVRHRIASYSAESTRYCKYDSDDITFIEPVPIKDDTKVYEVWKKACEQSEVSYNEMIKNGATPQFARNVLNNSLRVRYRCTMNIRELRSFFKLRCAQSAHPEFKIITIPFLKFMQYELPALFDDITYDENFYNEYLSNDRWKQYVGTD